MDHDAPQLTFDEFEIDCEQRQLRRDGEAIDLGSRYFDALVLLARNPGELISKDRFMAEVWRGVPVTDEALTQCIRTLRRALGENANDPRHIHTVPKHGYRFIGTVRSVKRIPAVRQGDGVVAAGRLVGATAVGGTVAGALAGGVYALMATTGAGGGAATIVVLATILGLLGATGIGFGMGLSSLWKGRQSWAVIAGGATGGFLVGALGSVIASVGMATVAGVDPGPVTGMFEGMALGLAAATAVVLTHRREWGRSVGLPVAAAIGAVAGGGICALNGRLLGGSFALIDARYPESKLSLSAIANVFGEADFLATTNVATGMVEGALFCTLIVAANLSWERGK